jgi:hypothetical protein
MTTATVAPFSGNAYAVLLAMFLVISAITCVGWWVFERRNDKRDEKDEVRDEQLATLAYQMPALLEYLGIEIPPPVVDDSPEAEEEHAAGPTGSSPLDGPLTPVRASDDSIPPDDAKTEEFPAVPSTVPDGIAIQVQSALIEARDLSSEFPHPVDSAERKALNAADIEERLKQFNFTGGRK